MLAANVLSNLAQTGVIFNDVKRHLERGSWPSVADAPVPDLGRPVVIAADVQSMMDEANRGRQAA
jgi:hypothetical protein